MTRVGKSERDRERERCEEVERDRVTERKRRTAGDKTECESEGVKRRRGQERVHCNTLCTDTLCQANSGMAEACMSECSVSVSVCVCQRKRMHVCLNVWSCVKPQVLHISSNNGFAKLI